MKKTKKEIKEEYDEIAEEEKLNRRLYIYSTIFKVVGIIVFLPIVLIVMIVFSVMKASDK